jgi:hypothetical protein
MRFTIWAYPWDVLDEGTDRVASRLRSLGINEVSLATNYHTIQAFTPHNPERRTLFARASSYFQPDDRYSRLEPTPYEGMDGDWLAAITAGLDDLEVTSWTVGCHNSRLGMTTPDVTLESPHGDDLFFGLCPSHPDVRAYLTALVGDLTARGVDRIELETFDYFHGTGFGWHHQKIHAELGVLGEFLLGLCFCEHCRATAADAGVDVDAARDAARTGLDDIVAGTIPAGLNPERFLRATPSLEAYVDARQSTLTALYADLERAADGTPLGYYLGTPTPGRERLAGVDLDAVADHVDYYLLPAYEPSRADVLEAYRTADAVTPDVPLHVGLLPGHPVVDDAGTLVDIVDGLRAADVPRVAFYNYGLLPDRALERISAATGSQ